MHAKQGSKNVKGSTLQLWPDVSPRRRPRCFQFYLFSVILQSTLSLTLHPAWSRFVRCANADRKSARWKANTNLCDFTRRSNRWTKNVFLNNNQKRSKYDDRWSQCNAFQCLVCARNYSITIQLKRDAYNIYLEISYDTHLIHTRAAILLVVENMTD